MASRASALMTGFGAALTVTLGGVVIADATSSPSSTDTVKVCINQRDFVVGYNKRACPEGSAATRINRTGPSGPAGPQGEPGAVTTVTASPEPQSAGPITAIGDSLTAGSPLATTDRWTTLLADQLDVTVTNVGMDGQTSSEIAARFGARPMLATVLGGTIPAGAAATLTAPDISLLRGGSAPILDAELRTRAGDVIPGRLQRTTADGSTYAFQPTTPLADPVPAPGRVEVWSTQYQVAQGQTVILGMGANDANSAGGDSDKVLENYGLVASAVENAGGRLLVWGALDRGLRDGPSTSVGGFLRRLEQGLRSRYGIAFCDVRGYLASQRALDDAVDVLAGWTPTAEDTSVATNGAVPPSWRQGATNLHLNELGQRMQAYYVSRCLTAPDKDWY